MKTARPLNLVRDLAAPKLLGYEIKPNGAADCGIQRPRCAAGVTGNNALGVSPRPAPSFVVVSGGEVQAVQK